MEPTGWKVIFLAESPVGATEQHGPPIPTDSHPNACVVLDLISAEPSHTQDTHNKVQLPMCEC